jgi:hypothetical protein
VGRFHVTLKGRKVKMHTLRNCLSVVLGLAISAAVLVVTGVGPGVARAASQVKEQVYEAKFECAIPSDSGNCSVTVDKEIPSGRRLRIEYIKARIVVPTAIKSEFEFYVDFGDPSAPGSVRSIHVVPELVGRTEGGFYNFYEVSEKVQTFAYRTENYPAPKAHLNNPHGDPMHLQNGSIHDGVLGGHLVGID